MPLNEGGQATLGWVETYVAMGDSFTEGAGCPPERRWADRIASALRRVNPALRFENLAVEGAPSSEVLEQLDEARHLRPDLASVICGANDVLLSVRPDIEAYARNLNRIFDALSQANPGVALFTATVPAGWESLEMRPRTKRRVIDSLTAVNERTREIARGRGIPFLDVARHPQLDDRKNFGSDGLHPSELGHERLAMEFSRLISKLRERTPGARKETRS